MAKYFGNKFVKGITQFIPNDNYGAMDFIEYHCNSLGITRDQYMQTYGVRESVNEDGDHEVGMAQGQLNAMYKSLSSIQQKVGTTEKDLPGWIQSHITSAYEYLKQVDDNFHELKEADSLSNSNIVNVWEATQTFPEYNNGLEPGEYRKEIKKVLIKLKSIAQYNDSDSSGMYVIKSEPDNANKDLTTEIKKVLKGFDDNLDLDNITSNIGQPNRISGNDQEKGIVTYIIPKKVDWWTLKRADGIDKPSKETKLTPEIIDSILDRMAQVSTTQDQLANTEWTSLEDLLKAAEDHMSARNYKNIYKEFKKKYPKIN